MRTKPRTGDKYLLACGSETIVLVRLPGDKRFETCLSLQERKLGGLYTLQGGLCTYDSGAARGDETGGRLARTISETRNEVFRDISMRSPSKKHRLEAVRCFRESAVHTKRWGREVGSETEIPLSPQACAHVLPRLSPIEK